ncbi:MAG: hypothetical protein JWO13_1677 [Acidobacteriales bacterium]|nr:hypothetical protein [Terriglobales bacterium]
MHERAFLADHYFTYAEGEIYGRKQASLLASSDFLRF